MAAGKSSRMGLFKPLLPLGEKSFIKTISDKLINAGVDFIVIVTGRDADLLKNELRSYEQIRFVHNAEYSTTEMLDSIKLGLPLMKSCDKFFFTTADIPLFTEETLRILLDRKGEIIKPSYQMRTGHPILLDRMLVEPILKYDGSEGLKGALNSTGRQISYVRVNDPGILYDADTPEDYEGLRRWINGQGNL